MKYLIDVRTTEEFNEGHRQGAINIPLDEIETIGNVIKELTINDVLELYCVSGGRAEMAKQILIQMGFRNVTNLGGFVNKR
jgi:phage shock protein E